MSQESSPHAKKNIFELKSSSSSSTAAPANEYEPLREEVDPNDNVNRHKQVAEGSIDSKSNSSEYPTTVTTSFNDEDDDRHILDYEQDIQVNFKQDKTSTTSSPVQSVSSRRLAGKFGQLMSSNPIGLSDHEDDDEEASESRSFVENKNNAKMDIIHRTISQSMLELDGQLNGSSKFEVVWSKLNFTYQPSWYQSSWFRAGDESDNSSQTSLGGCNPKGNQVLRNISGRFKSNQLIAIIGPSGCGKTTLLQFLAGNNPSERDKMRIIGLDEPKVAFIGQDDGLLPGLTAQETLVYASRLQNTRRNGKFNHQEHIRPILSELGLLECAQRSVTKLSGGQAKRVTIAQELLYPTNLLILDEVTSGLDASTSYSIVKLLKYLVSDSDYPMSIVMSIHQPSAKLFSVFDQVYVMSEGRCLYEGSCQVDLINDHLHRFNLACPKYHNIADYLIELACDETLGDVRNQMVQYHCKTSDLSNPKGQYLDHLMAKTPTGVNSNNLSIEPQGGRQVQLGIPMNFSLYDAIEKARRSRERPVFDHFVIHFSRSLLRIRRSYILTYLQLITYIILGLQLATFYGPQIGVLSGCPRLPGNLMSYILTSNYDNDSSDEETSQEMRRIQENMNFLLVSVMTATFAALEITVITFPLEAKTVKREWRNGWYRVSSYFMGRTLADLPFQLLFVVIFCFLIYILTGQIGLDTWRFGSFVGIIVMVALIAQSFGFIFGALFMDNLPAAVFTAPLCIFPTLLFSGFFSRVSQIPVFYKPLTYLSHFRYAFDGLLVTLYGFDRCQCDQEQLDRYHNSSSSQADLMRDMFRYLFGSNECSDSSAAATTTTVAPSTDDNLISSEDMVAIQANKTLAAAIASATKELQMSSSTPASSVAMSLAKRVNMSSFVDKATEDALVDSVFEHMLAANNASTGALASSNITDQSLVSLAASSPLPDTSGAASDDVMDHLAGKFTNKMTQMLNKQSNFGHPLPGQCSKFNSYLMTEFDLDNNDLIFGLVMLVLMVIITRVVCNLILNFTIANRTN